jgi:ubiquinone/menaquinone biosynthesis C-methylase UbiE
MAADEVAPARAVWRLGDYHRFARVAIRAAKAGADVVAADITPENFEPGRKEAETLGVALEWVEADAQALPFADAGFDVVTSSFGAIFAPDHQKVANELLRVCRPGGTIGLTSFRRVVWRRTSSGSSRRICPRPHPKRFHLFSGGPRNT